jgi:hypothetical protein
MNETDDDLARSLGRMLHELPLRSAPATLQVRVLAELERRAALAWWRCSFSQWPLLARAAFLVVSVALIRLALLGGAVAAAGVRSLHDSGMLSPSWAHDAGVLTATAGNVIVLLARTVPPAWAYTGIAAGAMLYAVLFGLGAALYRTVYLQPQNGR